MLLPVASIIFGFVILIWSADKLVDGAVSCAFFFGMPTILVGMLIVGLGTSSPEILVSIMASMEGNSGIVIGNAYGSNIANIALIMGSSALLFPVIVHRDIVKREIPVLIGITTISVILLLDGIISFWDSFILLNLFLAYVGYSIYIARKKTTRSDEKNIIHSANKHHLPIRWGIFWLLTGLILLSVSSRILVWGAVEIAHILGIDEVIIGLTVIAFGTSLPELATSVMAAFKKEPDISVGNIIGSNLFNTLVVVGIGGAINEIPVSSAVIYRDVSLMCFLTLLLFVFCLSKTGRIGRIKGGVFLTIYLTYFAYLFIQLV